MPYNLDTYYAPVNLTIDFQNELNKKYIKMRQDYENLIEKNRIEYINIFNNYIDTAFKRKEKDNKIKNHENLSNFA